MCSPCSKAVLSLPWPIPVIPSQVIIPCLGFNGHSFSSLIEGEGQLDESVVNKINTSALTHSPEPKTALALFISKPTAMLWAPAPYPSPCPPRELLYMMGFKHRSHIVSTSCSWKEGSHVPEPHGVLHAHLSGSMLGKWLLWKPPDAKELKQHASHVVSLVISETSAAHSPKHIVALSPFASKPATVPQAHIAPLLQDTAATRRPIALFSVQPAQCTEVLFPPRLRQKTGLGIHWKRPTARERK
jgi:hypothetical protein